MNPLHQVFCHHCHCAIPAIENAFFVEDHKLNPYCSESCIEEKLQYIGKHLAKFESDFCKKFGINYELHQRVSQSEEELGRTLTVAKDVDTVKTKLKDEYHIYSHIDDSIFRILVCYHFQGKPSYVFYHLVTSDINLFRFIQHSLMMIEDGSDTLKMVDIKLTPSQEEQLEQLRGTALSYLLENDFLSDIPIEEHGRYQKYLDMTMDEPDGIFENHLHDQFKNTFIYLKSFTPESGEDPFYYVVWCAVAKKMKKEQSSSVFYIPFHASPTKSEYYLRQVKAGNQIAGHLKN